MTSDELLGHMAYKIANATVYPFPMPHIYVQNVFPKDFYSELIFNLPSQEEYAAHEGHYANRKFNDTKAMEMLEPLRSREWLNIAVSPFKHDILKRFGSPSFKANTDLRLVMDSQGYKIGPHTDAPHKVLSFLFYLPTAYGMEDFGTRIYLPKDPKQRCEGGPHYEFDGFVEVAKMPYFPNSLFAFFKTNFGFHGVPPITIPCRRDVLLWNLYGEP